MLKKVPHLENTEVILVHCNIVKNDYQHDSRVLYTFVPNKPFGQLLDISPKKIYFFKKLLIQNFLYIDVWLTDHNSKLLQLLSQYFETF